MPKWLLQTVEISGGFLPGLMLTFPPGLTCIIGPRGSGKSTLAEIIRFGIGGNLLSSKTQGDLLKHNLGQSVVTIRTAPDYQGEAYVIRRGLKQQATLTTTSGAAITSVDLDRGTFLPLDAYSSSEIEDIARESLGEKRRSLLDELRQQELQSILDVVSERRRALEANADQIKAARRFLADVTERIEEIGDADAKLIGTPAPIVNDMSERLVHVTKQQQANKTELSLLDRAKTHLMDLREGLIKLAREEESNLEKTLVVEGSVNASILRTCEERLRTSLSLIKAHFDEMTDTLATAQEDLGRTRGTLLETHSAQEAEYAKLREQDLETSEAIRTRTVAEQLVIKLHELKSQKEKSLSDIQTLLAKRKSLKSDYLLERERISRLRTEVADSLNHEAGEKVKVRVLTNADNLNYRQLLTEGLKGASVKNHEDLLDKLIDLRPEHLAQLIQENDIEELDRETTLGKERSSKILSSFREKVDPFALETVTIDDRIRIELNVATDDESNFKDAAELSRGQQCTAMLPLLLARRNTPLIIDQPEDNLDNRFIYETVVESIHRLKLHRQLIFITHNANIPVLGEADLVVVLNSDGKRGFIEKMGNLDECRDHIVNLLEGGPEAFELRRQRYAKP